MLCSKGGSSKQYAPRGGRASNAPGLKLKNDVFVIDDVNMQASMTNFIVWIRCCTLHMYMHTLINLTVSSKFLNGHRVTV